MSLSGLCQVCERAAAAYGCERCGAAVCATHYDRKRGFCIRCVRGGAGDVADPGGHRL